MKVAVSYAVLELNNQSKDKLEFWGIKIFLETNNSKILIRVHVRVGNDRCNKH